MPISEIPKMLPPTSNRSHSPFSKSDPNKNVNTGTRKRNEEKCDNDERTNPKQSNRRGRNTPQNAIPISGGRAFKSGRMPDISIQTSISTVGIGNLRSS